MRTKLGNSKPQKKDEKISKRFESTPNPVECTSKRIIEKEQRTRFNQMWSTTRVKVASECFHNNFIVGFQAHPLGYKRFGLVITYAQQRMARMQLAKHVSTKLQASS